MIKDSKNSCQDMNDTKYDIKGMSRSEISNRDDKFKIEGDLEFEVQDLMKTSRNKHGRKILSTRVRSSETNMNKNGLYNNIFRKKTTLSVCQDIKFSESYKSQIFSESEDRGWCLFRIFR
jgi:uncharacterized protein YajQ (UPF0234 family)